jgi:hypothetical protein
MRMVFALMVLAFVNVPASAECVQRCKLSYILMSSKAAFSCSRINSGLWRCPIRECYVVCGRAM